MLSNSDTSFIRELYRDFKEYTSQVHATRAINCKATKRTGHTGLLVRNYKSTAAIDDGMSQLVSLQIASQL